MKKKRWIYLMFLIAVFIVFFINPTLTLLSESSFLDNLSFFYAFKQNQLVKSIINFLDINTVNNFLDFIDVKIQKKIFVRIFLKIFITIFCYLFGIISLKIYKRFFEQACLSIKYDRIKIVKKGILAYGIILLMIFIFAVSIVGYGISLIFLFLLFMCILIGKVIIGLFIGKRVFENKNDYINFIFGMSIIEVAIGVPYFGVIVSNVIMPIFSVGLILQVIENLFIKRKFYEDNENLKKVFDKKKIYDIIINDRSDNKNE